MKKFIVFGLLVSSLSTFAQNSKDKTTTGHKNVISSTLKSVGNQCTSNFESVLNQLGQVLNSERTSVTVRYEHAVSYEQDVEFYDMRTIKNESGKSKQKINIRRDTLINNNPAVFSKSVSFIELGGSIDEDPVRKSEVSVIAELGLLSRELKLECKNSIATEKAKL